MARARSVAAVVLIAFVASVAPAHAGHESSFYPSYYPQEIRLETVDPAAAVGLLQRASIHAFVGEDLFPGRAVPLDVNAVESLGSYVVITFNTPPGAVRDRERRCELAKRLTAHLAGVRGKFVFHPYPVTPYHADYLEHTDLAEIAKHSAVGDRGDDSALSPLEVAIVGHGPLAESLVKVFPRPPRTTWGAQIATIDVADLLTSQGTGLDRFGGPPWFKDGWFHAYLLLADRVSDAGAREQVERLYHRLVSGSYGRSEEKVTLARALVTQLRQGCERVVVGYTTRRSYINSDYSQGVENVGYDSHLGLPSAIFVRTVKLKDFPWNGQLRIGMAQVPSSAWNPIGGFRDPFGRMLWAAVGDPALLPAPHARGWTPNRVTFQLAQDESWLARLRRFVGAVGGGVSGTIEIPADAVVPTPGTGRLIKVGPGKSAAVKGEYRVLASSFHDGTAMTVADALYPFIVAYHWGSDSHMREYDPLIARATAFMRDHLVGLRHLRTDRVVRNLGGDLQLEYDVHVIEVYLNAQGLNLQELATVAPPWSTVPWHLMALMEAAVAGGVGTFSAEASAVSGLPPLELVRIPQTREKLANLLDAFERQRYVPEGLAGWMTTEDAQRRWRALRDFYQRHGHLLVTNGPYRLAAWSDRSVRLEVFRDLSYPLGVGSFDRHARPRHAFITGVDVAHGRLQIHADVERGIKFERSYRIVRERLGSNTSGALDEVTPVCRYLVLAADGKVVKDATAVYGSEGMYTADVARGLDRGDYRILMAIFLNDNYENADVRIVPFTKP